jgi:hypothetical protein
VASHTNELLYCRWGRRWKSLSSTRQFPSTMPMKYPKPYIFGTLFSEELLQRRDVVSLSSWKLYIPYRIGIFSRCYGNLKKQTTNCIICWQIAQIIKNAVRLILDNLGIVGFLFFGRIPVDSSHFSLHLIIFWAQKLQNILFWTF